MNGRLRLSICIALLILATAMAASPKVGSRRGIEAAKRVASASSRAKVVSSRSVDSRSSSSRSSSSSSSKSTKSIDYPGALLKTVHALARSHSTSEVLTLNLTNLLILVVLKAIIFGIGLFYFGGVSFKGGHGGGGSHGHGDGGHGGYGRSLAGKSSSLMSQGELLLMMTYILGATNDNYECMYRVACEDPSKAKDYLNASKMILKGAKFAKKFISYNPKYEDVVSGLQSAVAHKAKGGDCKTKYVCSDIPNL